MQINKALHLVIPAEGENGKFYIHASSISRLVFEQFFFVISKTFAELYTNGPGVIAGPRVAMMMLRKVARDQGVEREVEIGLINEIKRLANVLINTERGWEMITLDEAINRKLLDEDDVSEVENALAFFTLASVMHRRTERKPLLEAATSIWGGQITSSDCMEFLRSLPTSTVTVSSGETNPASLAPY